MDASCAVDGCSGAWAMECPHGRWCGAHVPSHMGLDEGCRPELAKALIILLRDHLEPALKLADAILPIRNVAFETAREVYGEFYPDLRLEYEEAGEPYGPTSAGLWRWLEGLFEERAH